MFVVLVLGEGATYYILHWLSASLLLLELLFLSKINKPNLNIYPTVLILKLASCSLEKCPHCSSFFLYLSYIFVILFFSIFVSSYIFLYLEIQTHTDTQVSQQGGPLSGDAVLDFTREGGVSWLLSVMYCDHCADIIDVTLSTD